MIGVDEYGIAEVQESADDIAKLERRIRLVEREFADANEAPGRVWIGDARETEIRIYITPPPGARVSLARSANLVIGTGELIPKRAISFVSAQRVGQMPRQRQHHSRVADSRGVRDDVLPKATLVSLLFFDACGKDAAEVPVAVLMLSQVYVGAGCLHSAKQNPSIKKIARVVRNGDRTRGKEHRVFVVTDFDGIDGDAADQSTAQMSNVDFPFDPTLEQSRDHAPHALLAHARVRDTDEPEHDNDDQPEQDDRAADGDAETAGHARERRGEMRDAA